MIRKCIPKYQLQLLKLSCRKKERKKERKKIMDWGGGMQGFTKSKLHDKEQAFFPFKFHYNNTIQQFWTSNKTKYCWSSYNIHSTYNTELPNALWFPVTFTFQHMTLWIIPDTRQRFPVVWKLWVFVETLWLFNHTSAGRTRTIKIKCFIWIVWESLLTN